MISVDLFICGACALLQTRFQSLSFSKKSALFHFSAAMTQEFRIVQSCVKGRNTSACTLVLTTGVCFSDPQTNQLDLAITPGSYTVNNCWLDTPGNYTQRFNNANSESQHDDLSWWVASCCTKKKHEVAQKRMTRHPKWAQFAHHGHSKSVSNNNIEQLRIYTEPGRSEDLQGPTDFQGLGTVETLMTGL